MKPASWSGSERESELRDTPEPGSVARLTARPAKA